MFTRFTVNVSNSAAPPGIYLIHWHEPIKRDDLVLLRSPLKRLVGWPGDTVRTSAEGSYVNGKLIPNSGIPDGSPYTPCPFTTYRLAEDQYWVLGDNPLSYDSRYYCAVPYDLIWTKVSLLWAF